MKDEPHHHTPNHHWDAHASDFERLLGQFTWPVGATLMANVQQFPPIGKESKAIDIGCGTGNVVRQLAAQYSDLTILAVDRSASMLESTAQAAEKKGRKNVQTVLNDATALEGIPAEAFSHALSVGLVGSTHASQQMAREMYWITQPGGIVGITSWTGRS